MNLIATRIVCKHLGPYYFKIMMKKRESIQPLKKSVSMSSLIDDTGPLDLAIYKRDTFGDYRKGKTRNISGSSVDICVVLDSDSDEPGTKTQLADSGIVDRSAFDGEMLQVLEQKIDRLSDMFLEQCHLLTNLKEDIRSSKAAVEMAEASQSDVLADLVNKTVFQSGLKELVSGSDADSETNSRARSLLNAIEVRQKVSADGEIIRDALASYLQSDELKEQMVAATAESVKGVVGDCLSRDLSTLYLPILEHSHRRLVRQIAKIVEDAFIELEENSARLSKSVCKITKSLRHSIERHQHLLGAAADPQKNPMDTLKCTVEELLHNELQQWRQKVLDVFSSQLQQEGIEKLPELPELPEPSNPPLEHQHYEPTSPHQPNRSIIDQLMIAAEISKQIQEGDVNAAFERALSAADLSLVTAACRSAAAARADVFAPRCRLRQPVLLALLQQLSTDMLHDTQLKCRFLEDSIMNLDPTVELTRAYLPLVVGEVRKHLRMFLSSYPSHVDSRRIALIIMAADNLLK